MSLRRNFALAFLWFRIKAVSRKVAISYMLIYAVFVALAFPFPATQTQS